MIAHLKHHAVAYVALVLATTGTAVAAAPALTGAKIQDGTLNSADLRDRGSTTYPGPSIQARDVEADALTGAEIDESTLALAGGEEPWDFVGDGDGPEFVDENVCEFRAPSNTHNYGNGTNPAAFYRDQLGRVHLQGTVVPGSGPALFTLPEGYRPAAIENHLVATANGARLLTIAPTGEVGDCLTPDGWVSLDGISFRAAS